MEMIKNKARYVKFWETGNKLGLKNVEIKTKLPNDC